MSNQVLIYSALLRCTWNKHFFHSSRRINNNSYGTKSLGPIVCSAQCNPPCKYHWIKPDESVVDGSNIEISSLSTNDHEHLHVMQAMVMVTMQQRTYN